MNELKEILQESVTRLFGDLVTREALTAAEDGTWPTDLWSAVEENGLANPLIPEDRGGVGARWEDVFVIVKAAGYFAAPVPLPETILASWLADAAGLEVPSGPLTVARGEAQDAPTTQRSGDGWRLTGHLAAVPWGGPAKHVVTLVEKDGQTCVALAATDDATVEADLNIAQRVAPQRTVAQSSQWIE